MSNDEGKKWLEQVDALIERTLLEPDLSVRWLSRQVYLSERQFSRRLREITGKSPAPYLQEKKLLRAHKLFSAIPPATVREVAELLNYSDIKYFSRRFYQRFGVYPSEVNREGSNGTQQHHG